MLFQNVAMVAKKLLVVDKITACARHNYVSRALLKINVKFCIEK